MGWLSRDDDIGDLIYDVVKYRRTQHGAAGATQQAGDPQSGHNHTTQTTFTQPSSH